MITDGVQTSFYNIPVQNNNAQKAIDLLQEFYPKIEEVAKDPEFRTALETVDLNSLKILIDNGLMTLEYIYSKPYDNGYDRSDPGIPYRIKAFWQEAKPESLNVLIKNGFLNKNNCRDIILYEKDGRYLTSIDNRVLEALISKGLMNTDNYVAFCKNNNLKILMKETKPEILVALITDEWINVHNFQNLACNDNLRYFFTSVKAEVFQIIKTELLKRSPTEYPLRVLENDDGLLWLSGADPKKLKKYIQAELMTLSKLKRQNYVTLEKLEYQGVFDTRNEHHILAIKALLEATGGVLGLTFTKDFLSLCQQGFDKETKRQFLDTLQEKVSLVLYSNGGEIIHPDDETIIELIKIFYSGKKQILESWQIKDTLAKMPPRKLSFRAESKYPLSLRTYKKELTTKPTSSLLSISSAISNFENANHTKAPIEKLVVKLLWLFDKKEIENYQQDPNFDSYTAANLLRILVSTQGEKFKNFIEKILTKKSKSDDRSNIENLVTRFLKEYQSKRKTGDSGLDELVLKKAKEEIDKEEEINNLGQVIQAILKIELKPSIQELNTLISRINKKNTGTVEIDVVPTSSGPGVFGRYAVDISSAAYTNMNKDPWFYHLNMICEGVLVGNIMLYMFNKEQNKEFSNYVIARGFNLKKDFCREIDLTEFVNQIIIILKQIARKNGRKAVYIPTNDKYHAISNSTMISLVLSNIAKESQQQNIPRSSGILNTIFCLFHHQQQNTLNSHLTIDDEGTKKPLQLLLKLD